MYDGILFKTSVTDKVAITNDDNPNTGLTGPLLKGLSVGNNGAKANLTEGDQITIISKSDVIVMPVKTKNLAFSFEMADMTLADNKNWNVIVLPNAFDVPDFKNTISAEITGIWTPNDKATNDGPARRFTPIENSADGKNKATVTIFDNALKVSFTNVLTKDVVAAKGALILEVKHH